MPHMLSKTIFSTGKTSSARPITHPVAHVEHAWHVATLTACVRAQTNGWRVQHVWHTSRDNCCAMKSMHAIRLRMLCQLAVEHPRKLEKARGAR